MIANEVEHRDVNIFTLYHQEENDFTNGLVSLLHLSRQGCPKLIPHFSKHIGLPNQSSFDRFLVQVDTRGKQRRRLSVPDAELSNPDCCVYLETKIVSNAIDADQIANHLVGLMAQVQPVKRLVMLTPDDGNSRYVQEIIESNSELVTHLEWKTVNDLLSEVQDLGGQELFVLLVQQFLDRIKERVFAEDLVGIIQTLRFGDDTEIYPDRYQEQLRSGEIDHWNTPREYKQLSGTRRKLLLYDPEVRAITVEVVVERVSEEHREVGFPWTNRFVPGSLRVFETPIGRDRIRRVDGLHSFAKNQSAYRNLTHEQYRELVETGSSLESCRLASDFTATCD
jgi:hypothetical protein